MPSPLEQALKQLKSPDAAERLSALAALRTLGDYAAIPALVACLKADPDPEVRATAAEVSRRLTEDRANPRDPYGIFGL